ncbi:hypothetical protein KA017_03360 [Candidatus Woesebacteria bacterium]|nr:hypothetical protein [Candidatus Woesebacteria bacterium]
MKQSTVLKKLRDILFGAIAGLLIMAILMIGPYPEGTSLIAIVKAHAPLLIGSAALGAIAALALTASSSE